MVNSSGEDTSALALVINRPVAETFAPNQAHKRFMNLTGKQFQALEAVCDALVPAITHTPDADGYWRRTASDVRLAQRMVEALAFVSPDEQQEFRQLLDLLASPMLGLTWFGTLRPAQALSVAERERLLQAWAQSRLGVLRKGFSALKKLTLFLYYGYSDADNPNPTWRSIGYPGPLSEPPAEPVGGAASLATLRARDGETLTCDVVVIGSGAGGGVVAGELAEACKHVIIIEKGSYVAENAFTQRETEMMARLYEAGGTLTTRDGAVNVLAGSCLGGGTTVNWSAALRTPEYVLEAWATKHNNPDFLSAAYRQSFDAVERATDVDTDESQHNTQNQALHNGATALGYDIGVIPRNAKGCTIDECKTCGYCCFGCQRGSKQSTLKTYVQRAFERGTSIYANAEAERIVIERGAATGVQVRQRIVNPDDSTNPPSEVTFRVKAQAVVVAAGSLHTPALLMRSGVQHPHLGRHLNLHPTVAVAARYAEPVHPWWGNMMTALSNEVANVHDGYGAKIETPPIHSGLLAMALPWISGKQHKETMLHAPHIGGFIVLTRDRDGGRVTTDKRGKPVLHYALSDYDRNHLLQGIATAARIHQAAGALEVYFPHNSFPTFSTTRGAAALETMLAGMKTWGWGANRFPLFSAHQMATCRMGGNKATHPLAPNGELHTVRNLFVTDASAFPECSGANPMLSVQALAHFIAQGIKTRC